MSERTLKKKLRVLGFDTESYPSSPWWGDATTWRMSAFAWKWSDEKTVHSLLKRSDGHWTADDGTLYPADIAFSRFRDELVAADLVYGHNVRRHDLPRFNSGLLRLQLPVLPSILASDTLKDLPKRDAMSASLENLASMYGLKSSKMHMGTWGWEQANEQTEEGVALAKKRVTSDVLLHEQLRDKLLELNLLKPPRRWTP